MRAPDYKQASLAFMAAQYEEAIRYSHAYSVLEAYLMGNEL